MRRAVLSVALILAVLAAGASFAERSVERTPDVIDGAGLVNYMQRPNIPVGTWVKYHTTSNSEHGFKDDYTVTVLWAGEEMWWGEPCFWVETRTQKAGKPERVTATLVSYAAFGDSMAEDHVIWFIRKTVNGLTVAGKPEVNLYMREKGELKLRRVNWEQDPNPTRVDSLGADTATVVPGLFDVFKVRRRYGVSETVEEGDSTTYYERVMERIYYYSPKVPITNLVKLEIDDHQRGKTWMAGKFDDSQLKTLERARGQTRLIGYGTSGVDALLVPEEDRHSIDRARVEGAFHRPKEPVKAAPRRGSGS